MWGKRTVTRIGEALVARGTRTDDALDDARREVDDTDGSASPTATLGRVVEEEAPVIRFVNELIYRAVHDGASDLHVEPTRGEVRIRFRVDGVLRDIMDVPRPLQPRIVSRIKIMGEMDIADRRAPQDGRATMVVDGRRVDLRVVSFPTTNGEAVVLRLLDKSGKVMG